MRGLLLAAGYGSRLRPITNTIPKCLVPVDGKPLLEYWLELLFPKHIERAIVNTHYLSNVVENYVEKSKWRPFINIAYEKNLLGTGGTILENHHFFDNRAFMVAHADNLTMFDVESFISCHEKRASGIEITMMTFMTDAPQSCGIVEVTNQGTVIGFHEKVANPPTNFANAAVYIFEPSVIDFLISLKKPIIDLSNEVLPNYMNKIQVFHNTEYHRDIGTPESLRLANLEWKKKLLKSRLVSS